MAPKINACKSKKVPTGSLGPGIILLEKLGDITQMIALKSERDAAGFAALQEGMLGMQCEVAALRAKMEEKKRSRGSRTTSATMRPKKSKKKLRIKSSRSGVGAIPSMSLIFVLGLMYSMLACLDPLFFAGGDGGGVRGGNGITISTPKLRRRQYSRLASQKMYKDKGLAKKKGDSAVKEMPSKSPVLSSTFVARKMTRTSIHDTLSVPKLFNEAEASRVRKKSSRSIGDDFTVQTVRRGMEQPAHGMLRSSIIGGCPETFDSIWYYGIGMKVSLNGIVYDCLEEACSMDGYEPGSGSKWEEVWKVVGSCHDDTYVPSVKPAFKPSLHPSVFLGSNGVNSVPFPLPSSAPKSKVSHIPTSIPKLTASTQTDATLTNESEAKPENSPLDSISTNTMDPSPAYSSGAECEGSDRNCCGSLNRYYTDYRGTMSITEHGYECARWDSDFLGGGNLWFNFIWYPEAGLEDGNYCRNPTNKERAWCYTEDNKGFDYCNVPECAPCHGSDPLNCGCNDVSQIDYRGTMSITMSGHECERWDAEWVKAYPVAGLEDGKFCRNPDPDLYDLPWCFTTDPINENGWESCDVPICEDSVLSADPTLMLSVLPTASNEPINFPTDMVQPTSSNRPTISLFNPLLQPECDGANPKICGCGSAKQADYRGYANTTKSGFKCDRWDSEWIQIQYGESYVQYFPNAGLKDGNYCRNPGSWDHAWCYTSDLGSDKWEYCDVPHCSPSLEGCSSLDSNVGTISDNMKDACAYKKCVDDVNEGGCECLYEIWDCKHGSENCKRDGLRIQKYQCCSNKADDSYASTEVASCECSINLDCERGNGTRCHKYAEICCGEDDSECKFEYEMKACRLSFGDGFDSDITHMFCEEAADSRCGTDNGGCECDFWYSLCNEFPDHKKFSQDTDSCGMTERFCCGMFNTHCYCDLLTYVANDLDYNKEKRSADAEAACAKASNVIPSNSSMQTKWLKSIYVETGGNDWFNNAQWEIEQSFCKWFGISCDSDGNVVGIRLRKNNLTGEFPSIAISKLHKLQILDLAENNIWGTIGMVNTLVSFDLRELTRVDLSLNNLRGEVDVLFAPALEYANFSHNNFTSINRFKQFKRSHQTLRVCDLSHNSISMRLRSDLMRDFPPNLEQLFISNNLIEGTLPKQLGTIVNLSHLNMASNLLSGELPDFSTSYRNLLELNLSNNKQQDSLGFFGTIPEGLMNLQLLKILYLAGNGMNGTIPAVLGNFAQLKELDLSGNMLRQSIPSELGKLVGTTEVINLADNLLEGTIPTVLGQFKDASVVLNGNAKISAPAPLSLCCVLGFDLKDDKEFCPPERNALKEFYDSTKGGEWTESKKWTDEFESHCSWQGVTCDATNTITTVLNLANNGLSGKLSERIGNLRSLEVLDLNDNDIKGSIPTEIGLLSNLTYLRLSHNAFVGNAPTELGNLKQIRLIQLQGNRISGTIPHMSVTLNDRSSSVADCGVPSAFGEPLICDDCTMCCNSQGDCVPQEKTNIQHVELNGFENYVRFTWVFFLCIFGVSCALTMGLYLHGKYQDHSMQASLDRQRSVFITDTTYALDKIGDNSVYQFFLSKSLLGWAIALATIGFQVWMMFVFVEGAEFDVSNENSDFVYTWKCPRDRDQCDDKADLNWQGWAVFGILMTANLSKDIINGVKLIVLSGREKNRFRVRMRFFFGGFLLVFVTLFTLYVSTIYNDAIATSNTEIIVNSVVILFVTDVDELAYDILSVINLHWVIEVSQQWQQGGGSRFGSSGEAGRYGNSRVDGELKKLKSEIEDLKEAIGALKAHANQDTASDVSQHSNAVNMGSVLPGRRSEGSTNESGGRANSVSSGKRRRRRQRRISSSSH